MNKPNTQHSIYLRSTKESIPVTKEEFDAYYHEINSYRIRQQRHGSCVCPAKKRLWCDMDCLTCPFYRVGETRSLDVLGDDGDGNELSWAETLLADEMPLEEAVANAEEMKTLFARLTELMPEAIIIGQLRLDGLKDFEIAKEINIGNTTFLYRLKKVKEILKKEFPNFF